MIPMEYMEIPHMETMDAKQAKARIEEVFAKYRMCKVMKFAVREAKITANYETRENGATNRIGDPTAAIAVYNTDKASECLAFCELVESIVNELEPDEQLLIRERYMKAARMTDTKVYCFSFDPPISAVTYGHIRKRAFEKLLHAFQYAFRPAHTT
ncbi:ArpU family transcriptional regulator [Paenibacillus profundus]|uniref:ArpU family transcriptional regulator n=1 Tax=Paenibacillus profundus TaxID=1173085 RepID=A0ABS8YAL0_9BACL|nr:MULTISPECIES: ArpU family phage packaging/lysis transcriptional regulator [Paenibacillus]MCE5168973.1 ArpU family transcriptional regulator [Paenibacillus profundus]MCM3338219.1 ArpU family transcriptional regulator [Paenibacillus sp. MER TA 81-3]